MLKERLAKLISVKSIVTLLLSILVMALAIKGIISGSQIVTIYTVVIGFYFGTQSEKKAGSSDDTGTN